MGEKGEKRKEKRGKKEQKVKKEGDSSKKEGKYPYFVSLFNNRPL